METQQQQYRDIAIAIALKNKDHINIASPAHIWAHMPIHILYVPGVHTTK